KGRMWFAGKGGGLVSFDTGKNTWVSVKASPFAGDSEVEVKDLIVDDRGQVVIGTTGGLLIYDESRQSGEGLGPENSSLPEEVITAVYKDRAGRVWVGTGEGLVIFTR